MSYREKFPIGPQTEYALSAFIMVATLSTTWRPRPVRGMKASSILIEPLPFHP
jgi:hypothetical protein